MFNGGRGPAPAPKAAPKPPVRANVYVPPPSLAAPSAGVGSVLSHAASQIGHAIGHVGQAVATPAPKGPGGDVQSGGGYGQQSARANAYKNTPAYRQAVLDVFLHQPKSQAMAILRGAHTQPSYEGNVILGFLQHLGMSVTPDGNAHLTNPFSKALDPFRVNTGPIGAVNQFQHTLEQGGHWLSDVIQQIPTSGNGSPNEQIAARISGMGPGQIGKNLGKDLVNLPAEIGPSIAIPAMDVVHGKFGQAASAFGKPIVNTFEHPLRSAVEHPLYTYLMAGGPIHGITRIADQGARAIVGKPADLNVPSTHLTGELTREQPNLSKYPLIRRSQKGIINARYTRAGGELDTGKPGEIVHRSQSARNRAIRLGVAQRVGMDERIRRAMLAMHERAHYKNVLAKLPQRVARSAKTALRYNPKPALIRGGEALALISQGIIRRPETALHDLAQYVARRDAAAHELADFPKAAAEYERITKPLRAELARWQKSKNLPAELGPAFHAAEQHGAAFNPLEKQAHALGHFGKDVTAQELERRVLTPIVLEHMQGARFDPNLKTAVVDEPGAIRRALISKEEAQRRYIAHLKSIHEPRPLQDAAVDTKQPTPVRAPGQPMPPTGTRVLSTTEMRAFAKKETGGRTLSYASHQAPRGDSAFYVNSQKFPAKAVQRNSYYAFQHGLIDPSHEALLHDRVHLQGVVSAHESMSRMLGLLTVKNGEGYWKSFQQAKADAPPGYSPIYVGRIHGYGESVTPHDAHDAASIELEAMRHSVDLNSRLNNHDLQGNWALIHNTARDALNDHLNNISPDVVRRAFRGTTSQFRKVALGTSAKHIPGVLQENLIRDIANGVFVQHWIAERNVFNAAKKINPKLAEQRRIELGGGQLSGSTRALATRQVSRHYAGTVLEGPLKGFEALMRAPGPRQLRFAWNSWLHFAIDGTKKVLEEQHQRAAVGKQLLNEWGGLMRLQGEAAHQAARDGFLDPRYARKLRAGTERMFGKWTDMTPGAQTALMASPFGMWWVNSVKFLGRLPVDHPLGTSALAAANVSSQAKREQQGLDMFAPNHLPLYEQGGIPIPGGKVLAQNYYSPFGVANDPLETFSSLVLPTITTPMLNAMGDNWLGRQMSSPQHPKGGNVNPGTAARVMVNSILSTFLPLYQKAQTLIAGGASQYDTSTLFDIQRKPGQPHSLLGGLKKATLPVREYRIPGASGGSSGGNTLPAGVGGGDTLPAGVGGSSSGGSGDILPAGF